MPHPPADTSQRLRALSAGLSEQGIAVLLHGPDGRFQVAEGLPTDWPTTEMLGRTASEVLPRDLADSFAAAAQLVQQHSESQSFEFELGDGEARRIYEARMFSQDHEIITTIADVTLARGRDTALMALLREVSHRSKNLLAIVQSVAMQTAINSVTTAEFLDRFRGRLHALSSTQDLVTESDWQGTHLQSLIAAQLTRVGPSTLAHMRVTGANPLLGPNAALHIGLAIHELAVNAVIHGGLGVDGPGHIWIDARFGASDDDRPDLMIEWQETGLRAPHDTTEPRFGTLVLERIVPLSVGGRSSLNIGPDAVRYCLTVPADQYVV